MIFVAVTRGAEIKDLELSTNKAWLTLCSGKKVCTLYQTYVRSRLYLPFFVRFVFLIFTFVLQVSFLQPDTLDEVKAFELERDVETASLHPSGTYPC